MTGGLLPPFVDRLSATLLLHDTETDDIVDANEAAEELYGYTVGELREVDVGRLSAENPRFSGAKAAERIQRAADGETLEFEWQIRRRNGELRWVEVELRPVDIDGERYVLAEIRDVTTFKTRTRRLQLLHRIIRHNLRNDMTVVKGHAEALESALEADDRERQAAVIKEVAADIGDLTDSVTQLEELATNDPTDFRPVQVRSLLEELATEFESAYPEATVTVEAPESIRVSADQGLRLGLKHAITNAIEHHDEQHPSVLVRAKREDDAPRIVVEVVDDGPKIPPTEVDAVDTEVATTQLTHGTGVGLYLMKWCAESLGGKLEVAENEPRGNVVRFVLPALSDREAESQRATE